MAERLIVNCRIVGRAACDRPRCHITSICVVVVGAVSWVVISRLVPLVEARQHIRRSFAAVGIGCLVIKRVSRSPQCDVIVDAKRGELVSVRAAGARIEPVDEPGRFVPRNACRGLSRATRVLGDLQLLRSVELRNHVLADLELTDTVLVSHGTSGIRCTSGIG